MSKKKSPASLMSAVEGLSKPDENEAAKKPEADEGKTTRVAGRGLTSNSRRSGPKLHEDRNYNVPTDRIDLSPVNQRDLSLTSKEALEQLAESIKKYGQDTPARGIHHPETNRWELLAGSRRWAACKMLGRELTVQVVPGGQQMSQAEKYAYSERENEEREQPAPMERARRIKSLFKASGQSKSAFAEEMQITRTWLYTVLDAADLPGEVLTVLDEDIRRLSVKMAQRWAKITTDPDRLTRAIKRADQAGSADRIEAATVLLSAPDLPDEVLRILGAEIRHVTDEQATRWQAIARHAPATLTRTAKQVLSAHPGTKGSQLIEHIDRALPDEDGQSRTAQTSRRQPPVQWLSLGAGIRGRIDVGKKHKKITLELPASAEIDEDTLKRIATSFKDKG